MLTALVFFVLGLVLLTVGGELLVRSATRLATDLGVSRLFIGLTVVALGTSAPEAVVSVIAALSGASELALGNVVGSNIFNVLLILGLSALILPLAVTQQLVRFDVPFLIATSLLLLVLGLDGRFGLWDGLLLLLGLVVHITVSYRLGLRSAGEGAAPGADGGGSAVSPPEGIPRQPLPWRGRALNTLLLVASLVLLVLGSRWLVDSASTLARWLGLSELVIGLTIVAAGTSLPEAATSIIAALRGERDIAVGNVVGSNILNILGVLGLASVLGPEGVAVPPAVLAVDLPVMVGVALICLPMFFTGLTLSRWEGGLLLGYFALYLVFVVLRATQHAALPGFLLVVGWIVLPLSLGAVALSAAIPLWRRVRRRGLPA